MKPFTQKYLGLVTTGNFQGSHKFLNMTTVQKLNKINWKPMTMPDVIIKRVEYLADLERRSSSSGGWRFCNRNHGIFAYRTEGDYEEPLIKQEVLNPDIPGKLPGG